MIVIQLMTYMIDDCLCSFSKTIFLMTLCAKMSDTMTFQKKKHIHHTCASRGIRDEANRVCTKAFRKGTE